MEFLGDRVLGLTIAYLLYNQFKNFDEGYLSKRYSYLVQRKFLYKIALQLQVDNFLEINFSNIKKKLNESILADSVESLIGAIFLDGGYTVSSKFIKSIWSKYINDDLSKLQDPKTKLQEISQQISKKLPEYNVTKRVGPSHSPTFTVSLKVLNLKKIVATGQSIRDAETNAAKKAILLINEKEIIKN